ncbi:MAG: hypothetical protein ACKO2G_07335 [Verrucomicrobiales bacterium]
MSKKQHISLWILLLLLAGIAWLFRPYEKPNLEQVEPRLLALSEPYQSLKVLHREAHYLFIFITDADGKEGEFLLYPSRSGLRDFTEMQVGPNYGSSFARLATRPVANSSETKKALLLRFDRYGTGSLGEAEAIYCLSGRTSDLARVFIARQLARWLSP